MICLEDFKVKDSVAKHLIIISFDAVTSNDYEVLMGLSNFSHCMMEGSFVKKVNTVYPSLTYPAHTTIITGNYPKKHGIVNNTLIQPGKESPDWYWNRKHIKCKTLYDLAKENNLTVASLLWPVTAKAKIKYNMPEIFPNKKFESQVIVSLLNGSPYYQIELNSKFGKIRNGLKQPELDNFVLASAIYTLKTYKPNLTLIHFTDVDSMRHQYGTDSKEAMKALLRHDGRLGELLNALKEADIYKDSNIVLLGDHGFLDGNKMICLNSLLRKNNLITLDDKGKIKDWKAYMKSCDGSAYIYLKDNKDKETLKILQKLIYPLKEKTTYGIEEILTGKDAGKLGADENCAFMLEACEGFYFVEDHDGDLIKNVNDKDSIIQYG
jgi:predicted AlkP superfamily pyrophosphatase or phosphodiesterase